MDGWVAIFSGPMWEVELKKSRLEVEGIDVFIPDASTKIIDPFVTGANPLTCHLWVRHEDAPTANEILALRVDGSDEETAAVEPTDPKEAGELWSQDEVETIARRARWSTFLTLTWPLALYYGFLYLAASKQSGHRASAHKLTLFAFGLGFGWLAVTLFVIWWLVTRS